MPTWRIKLMMMISTLLHSIYRAVLLVGHCVVCTFNETFKIKTVYYVQAVVF